MVDFFRRVYNEGSGGYDMRGVLLAGGTGSRLYPLTATINKHCIPVGDKPMLYHPIERMIEAGIGDILITTGIDHAGQIFQLLGSGSRFGVRFTYRIQDEAGGIAQALMLAEDFCEKDTMMVMLGDNIFGESLKHFKEVFETSDADAGVVLKKVPDPERFGVATVEDGKVVLIEEKPENPQSNYAVTGCYLYTPDVFDVIRNLKPSARGEYEISDVNMHYVKVGRVLAHTLVSYWSDAGTFESLRRASQLVSGEKDD